jgi:ubiquinone/menaquinone biosynthesis C-methylase UbiE
MAAGPDFSELKDRTRQAWSLGNYSEVARLTWDAAVELVEACAISAGQEVLDVAAGNGNLALLAAREGAAVVASDLTPRMVELGRERSAAEGYEIEWVVADVEELPFEDGRFDCAASVFGAMFAPRPEAAASEMFRVVRPGGTVGLASWTPDSFQGKSFAMGNRYVPMPEGVPPSTLWGDEEAVRQRLDRLAASISFERRAIPLVFESVQAFEDFVQNVGPSVARRQAVEPEVRERMREEFHELVREFNRAGDGSVRIDSEYLVVVARKRG